jgi:hypothetical protein
MWTFSLTVSYTDFLLSYYREKFLHLASDLVCIISTVASTDLKQSGPPTSDQTHVPLPCCIGTFLQQCTCRVWETKLGFRVKLFAITKICGH